MTEFRLSPLTVASAVLTAGIWSLVFGIPLAVVLGIVWSPWSVLGVFGVMLLVVGVTALVSWLRWRATTYSVSGERFVLKSGVLKRTTRTFARNRIRAIDLSSGPVQRLLGLASVHIGTAEQTGSDGSAVLTPVPRDEAKWLQAELLPRGGVVTTLGRFEPSWLRYAPLSWVPVAVAAGVLGVLAQFAEPFGELAWRFASDAAAVIGWWLIVGALVAVPLIIGVITSIVIHTELWWNHRLERDSGTIRVRRGLLTTRTVSLPEERLRGVRVAEPLGIRLVRGAQLEALAIGLKNQGSSDGNDELSQSNVLLPYAPRATVAEIAARVLMSDAPVLNPERLTPHPKGALRRRLLLVLWVVLGWVAITAPIAWLWLPGWWWAVVVGALVIAGSGVGMAWDLWRNLGHALDERHLVTRSGTLQRITDVLERDAIIGWNLRQSVFQRRRGLITVVATTGAGSGACTVLDAATDDGVALADAATPGLLTPFLKAGNG